MLKSATWHNMYRTIFLVDLHNYLITKKKQGLDENYGDLFFSYLIKAVEYIESTPVQLSPKRKKG